MHDDEEIRYALDGSAFFDIRGKSHLVNYNSRANWACPRGVHRPMDSHSRRCRGSSCPSGWNLPPLHPRRKCISQDDETLQGIPTHLSSVGWNLWSPNRMSRNGPHTTAIPKLMPVLAGKSTCRLSQAMWHSRLLPSP